jgi:hypothetical protein
MPWIADLIDGPLGQRSVQINDDLADEPPAFLDVEGHDYVYCGWADNQPRYRCRAPGESLGGAEKPSGSAA